MREHQDHEHEPVWSVEADVGGDGAVALPRPGGIAFPWRTPHERQPPTPEELERRRLRRERWGPPRADLDRRMLALTLGVLAGTLALAIFLFGLSITTDRYFLILL